MHDESLEQKLRATLRTEGDQLALTITAAELERRLAIRRRGGLGPMASLGLAAAVGVGLLGLAGLAGGWFEQKPVIAPSPSPVSIASTAPSGEPSSGPVGLPSLDDLLAPLDPALIVRAQAVGPAAGPSGSTVPGEHGARAVAFAPITTAGAYRVWTACLGSVGVDLVVTNPGLVEARKDVALTCDGSVTSRQVGLEAGDTISLRSATAVSWRVVVEAPARAAPRAPAIEALAQPAEDQVLLEASSQSDIADYGPTGTGGGLWLPADVGNIAQRASYKVTVTCAGPYSIRYAFGTLFDEQNRPDPLPEDHSATEVECDGAVHKDVVELPLAEGARFVVTSSDQMAWRILVTSDKPPIALAADGGGWQMSSGFGPNYLTDGVEAGVTLIGSDSGGDVRVVISCSGEATLSGTIDVGPVVGVTLDPFSLDCADDATLERVYKKAANYVDILYDPHGGVMWMAVSSQIRGPATPAP